jgi:molecular chaperone GrpE
LKNERDDERIDLNLDAEAVGESPFDAADLAALTGKEVAPGEGEESPQAIQDALMVQLGKLQAEKDDLYQTLVRRQADYENFRKRVERERQEDVRRGAAILIESLLPVLDAFERALAGNKEGASEQYRVGFELIYKQLLDTMKRSGLERIPAQGQRFDPFLHQAVERVETSEAEGTVLEELAAGYRFRGTVLRPSMVRVASAPATVGEADSAVN